MERPVGFSIADSGLKMGILAGIESWQAGLFILVRHQSASIFIHIEMGDLYVAICTSPDLASYLSLNQLPRPAALSRGMTGVIMRTSYSFLQHIRSFVLPVTVKDLENRHLLTFAAALP